MVLAGEVAEGLQDAAAVVEFHDAAGVDVREQPVVLRQAAGHALAHRRVAQAEIEARRAHAEPGHPVGAVRGAVDVVGIARHVLDDAFRGAGLRPLEPVAVDSAGPAFGEIQRLAVMRHAHAVGVAIAVEQRLRRAVPGVIDQQPAGAAVLDAVECPVMRVIALRRVGEIDPPVRRDVEVVRVAQPRVILHRGERAPGLGAQPRHGAVGRDLVKPHGADAGDQVAVAVECQPQREAADMGEDLGAGVVRCEEAHDLAMPGAAIEVVVGVEDHVLGPLERAQPDMLGCGEAVVQRIGRARMRLGRLGLAHLQIDRRDIDLVQHLVAVLQPADVDGDGDGQHDAQDHLVGAGAIAQANEPVRHHQHDHRAHQPLDHRAAPAAEGIAADDRRGEGEDLEPGAGARPRARQPAGDQEPRRARAQAGEDIGQEHRAPDLDAGVMRRAARAADGEDMPADAGAGQGDMGDERQQPGRDHRHRQPGEGAVADEVPRIRAGEGHLDRGAELHHQDVEDGAADDEGDKRGQKRPQPQEADEIAVDRAEDRAGRQRRQEGRPDRQAEDEERSHRGEGRQREDRAHREVDAAAEHHHGEADHHDRELAELTGRFLQAERVEEPGDRRAEERDHRHQHEERDRVVGPALGQDLADQVIGNEVVAQGLQAFA
ncbi:hypothetical protein SDC9_34410 [bioreactor metagenome]|uniref:Uncharacterized protein n=1 Tax=bioreactor metagenome TaxID=1076179 RepID=A0A644VAT2_9ZZZZ